mmetsp:Transcript_10207/g.31847  ORF Transcript_10207/g.31847 Transcript_10207/m.31847 type:complete len:134 (+) Transcript_10207:83-484(+)
MADGRVERNQITYNAAVRACEKGGETGQWVHALEFFREMVDSLIETDDITYTAAAGACSKGGDWARALDLLREMAGVRLEQDRICCNVAVMLVRRVENGHLHCTSCATWLIAVLRETPSRTVQQSVLARKGGK